MTIEFRPLADVKMILEEIGTDVSYAYDDLVFPEHTAFLIQFNDEKPELLNVFFNQNIEKKDAISMQKKLDEAAQSRKFSLVNSGSFSMEQKEDTEEIELKFYPEIL